MKIITQETEIRKIFYKKYLLKNLILESNLTFAKNCMLNII